MKNSPDKKKKNKGILKDPKKDEISVNKKDKSKDKSIDKGSADHREIDLDLDGAENDNSSSGDN